MLLSKTTFWKATSSPFLWRRYTFSRTLYVDFSLLHRDNLSFNISTQSKFIVLWMKHGKKYGSRLNRPLIVSTTLFFREEINCTETAHHPPACVLFLKKTDGHFSFSDLRPKVLHNIQHVRRQPAKTDVTRRDFLNRRVCTGLSKSHWPTPVTFFLIGKSRSKLGCFLRWALQI